MQHSQPFLASSVAEQCWQLSQSLPHVVLNVPCIEAERELGQLKVATLSSRMVLLTNNREELYVSRNISLHFFFPCGARGSRGRLYFFFLFTLNYFLCLLSLNDLF